MGVGKTRLAPEAARALTDIAPGDISWIDLAPLADPKLVPQVIAFALGVPQQSGRLILDVIADALALRRILIVLDSCEHRQWAIGNTRGEYLLRRSLSCR